MVTRQAVLAALVLLTCSLAGCGEKPGDLFAKTFGFPIPAGFHVEQEHRVITWESLFSSYYAKVTIETPTALETLCSRLGLQRSRSVRSLPMPAPNGVNWWISVSYEEAMKNPNRFLRENPDNAFVSIYVVGNTAYVFKVGQSVRR